MSKTENIKKAQRAASSPAARKKAVATLKRRRAENAAAATQSISLDAIPDPPAKRKYNKKGKAAAGKSNSTRQEVVLALLKYLNEE